MRHSRVLTQLLTAAFVLLMSSCSNDNEQVDAGFTRSTLFAGAADAAPWAKFTGDLNGDGAPELFVGYHGSGELLQLAFNQDPGRPVLRQHAILTDGGIADLNADGMSDIALLTEHGLFAFYAPSFDAIQISPEHFHDVRFLDENSDGQLEIVVRNQTAFGNGSGDIRIFARGPADSRWVGRTLAALEGEGLEIGDLDGDGDADIAAAGVWLENRDGSDGREWSEHEYSDSWDWMHAKIAIADLDGDGANEIILAPAEPVGERFRISWFRATGNAAEAWQETVLIDDVESIVHALQAGDVDLDGDIDLVYAEMHQGEDPDEVAVLENLGGATAWDKRIVDRGGSHNLQLLDWDTDGDLDIAGANWDGENQDVVLWTNNSCDAPWSAWRRHEIDAERPGQAVFVLAGDLNGDVYPDVVTGSMAYLNPGPGREDWKPVVLGKPDSDAAALQDFSGDGTLDILFAVDDERGRRFDVLQNDGAAGFGMVETGVSMSGDFLQGVASVDLPGNVLALSWHGAGYGVELLRMPGSDGGSGELSRISEVSQDEDLSAGDIDGDGDDDLLLGTSWLRNDGTDWSLQTIDERAPAPDRNELADLDGDGDLDAIVGFEAISRDGDIVWYESHEGTWLRHLVAAIVGPMSLDVADMDGDGDLDIISGEHNLDDPASAKLWIFENIDGIGGTWNQHRIYIGDEHHDGAQTIDIDLDGDLDIVSIGWGHDDVIWYENKMPACPGQTNQVANK